VTDVATTPRRKLSPRDRLAVWEAHGGVCCICGGPIDGTREKWIIEHVKALELGGADERANMAPAHEGCAVEKTRGDHAQAAKAKRRKSRHLGIKRQRTITRWRRFDGSIVIAPRER
jgi:5-methylcytosine-specific restriction endonuclease McrA